MAEDGNGRASLLAAIVETSSDAIISADLDGVITSWNAAAVATFGYTAAEIVGRSASVLLPSGRPDKLAQLLDQVRAGQRVGRFEAQRVRKDGSVIDVAISVAPLRDTGGAVTGAAAVIRDITEVRAAQKAQSMLAAIVDSSADAIVGKTLDGVITSWNAGAADMYGYAAQEMIGHNVSELLPPDRAGELVPILERVRRGQRVDHLESRRVRKDGVVIDVSVSASPVRDADGAVTGAATVARDITEQTRAAAEREASEARMHVAERLETVGQLAGGVAHDFNNLLAAIIGYAGLAAEEASDPALRADIEQILSMAQRASALTKELLVFSRREPGRSEEVDLNAVIAGMRNMLGVSVGEHIEMRVDPAAALPAVRTDPGRMEQVLLNLAVNARDAMPEGGSLTIATSAVDLPVGDPRLHSGIDPGRFVELAVSDTGTGMSADVAARIFEPFFTTKPTGQGTGLGLSTVYGIVTGAGGCIGVDSAEGAGTTFRIYLPAVGAPAGLAGRVAAAPGRRVPGTAGNGETVLVVDDERAVLEVTARILRRNGYATLEANTWEEALSLASSQEPELLLTDSVMPGMSGQVLADRIREVRPGVRALHMSGYSGGSVSPHLGSDDTAAFLQKPFTADTLLAKVREVLDSPPGD